MADKRVMVKIKIIANVDLDEFTPDKEELPILLEEIIEDMFHEHSGLESKDVSVSY